MFTLTCLHISVNLYIGIFVKSSESVCKIVTLTHAQRPLYDILAPTELVNLPTARWLQRALLSHLYLEILEKTHMNTKE